MWDNMDSENTPMKHVWLFPIWLGSMLFLYQRISPLLNLDLGIRISPDRLLFLVILGLFLKSTSGRRRRGTIEWLMLAFAMLATISWVMTRPDAEGTKLRWLTTVFQLAYFPFIAYYIAKNSDYSERDLRRLLNGVLIIQSYLVFTGLVQHYQLSRLVWPKYILDMTLSDQGDRLTGPFSNSSMLGAALVMNLGCLFIMTLYSQGSKRLYLYLLMILSCACIYLTSTRTVWLGLFAVLLIFYFSRTGLRKPVRNLALCLLAVALTGMASKFSVYQKSLFSRRPETVEYRRINLQAGLKVFQEHPLFGIGYGGFAKRMREGAVGFDEKALASGNENTWLGILVDLGLIGFLPYVVIFALLIRSDIQVLRRYHGEERLARPFATVALAMMTYTVINAGTGDLRFHLYDPCLVFLVQGIAARLGKPEEPVLIENDLEQTVEEASDFDVSEAVRVGVYDIQAKPA
jgi:O-antigen ligase